MDPVTINRRSWHYRLSNYMNDGAVGLDTCGYVAGLGKAVVKTITLTAFVTLIFAVAVVCPVWAVWITIVNGGLLTEPHALREVQTTGLSLVLAYIALILWIVYGMSKAKLQKKLQDYRPEATLRSLVSDAVWKKICRPVKFK